MPRPANPCRGSRGKHGKAIANASFSQRPRWTGALRRHWHFALNVPLRRAMRAVHARGYYARRGGAGADFDMLPGWANRISNLRLSTWVFALFAGAVILPWFVFAGVILAGREQRLNDARQSLGILAIAYGEGVSFASRQTATGRIAPRIRAVRNTPRHSPAWKPERVRRTLEDGSRSFERRDQRQGLFPLGRHCRGGVPGRCLDPDALAADRRRSKPSGSCCAA